ncbi:hypothetical protein [Ferrimonas balearica]|uniref:hypothetical protein n=1 Tax=Ferrimonas balearica TaxID=44012 RepID=UPI001C98FE8E|nr:hypothetical protein [Ferrimonas balearica]MBY5992852.1 hypothetical protein [Ferrimonas balearica]
MRPVLLGLTLLFCPLAHADNWVQTQVIFQNQPIDFVHAQGRVHLASVCQSLASLPEPYARCRRHARAFFQARCDALRHSPPQTPEALSEKTLYCQAAREFRP